MADNGFTPIPNCLLDRMSEMKPAEFKALMAIYRLVMGYKEYREKRRRHISITKLQDFVGLSRQGVINAMSALEDYGYVTKVETDGVNEWLVNSVDQEVAESSQDSVPVVNSVDGTSQDSLPPSNKRKVSKEINNKTRGDETLISFFEGMTAFTPPHDTTDAYAEDWLAPMQAILGQSKDFAEAEARVTYAIQHLRKIRYTIISPKSILKTALNWQPGDKAGANGHHTNGSAPDKAESLENIRKAVTTYGAKKYKQAMAALQEPERDIVKNMASSWRDVCMMDRQTFQVKYYQALKGS